MAKRLIEHPDDWNMHEGPFAKACSQLGYRLISLSDREDKRDMLGIERGFLKQIDGLLTALGG